MFETIAAPKGDPILTLIQEFQNDPRSDKIDLGIGVYRDNSGRTPIMKAVADAEKYLLENEITKAYQGLAGDEVFNGHLQSLLLSGTQAEGRASTLQTPGASGALRGADISLEAWQKIAGLASKNGFLPFVDIAYQGLGDGLSEDAAGLHLLADAVDEMLISTSCSKNFGLYRERIGGAIIVAKTAEIARNSRAKVCELARGTYSMPPAHGAAIVRTILQDESRRQSWQQELNAMNQRVNGLRKSLVESFRLASQSERFDFFGHHKGMFSLTDFSDDLISQLKAEHGIYIVAGGRINVAGLRESQVVTLVNAVITAGG
ncbi:MAG: aminotransferase class I/II-fold pyridoxal phosphate-dependent enzyme [Reinekea sp.]